VKLIEALKKCKDLQRKIDDLKAKIKQHCAGYDVEDATYGTKEQQSQQIKDWLQSIHDSIKEILRLRVAIQNTNLCTMVKINDTKKSIAEWIHRRRDLAELECGAWSCLTDKNLQKQQIFRLKNSEETVLSKLHLFFDPKIRDEKIEEYKSEPTTIDAKLEVVNAETTLIEEK